jgi:hypothetical protein
MIPTKDVDRISYEESTVFATLTGVTAQNAAPHSAPVGAQLDAARQDQLARFDRVGLATAT